MTIQCVLCPATPRPEIVIAAADRIAGPLPGRCSRGSAGNRGSEGRPQVIPVCFAFDGEAIYIVLDQKPKSVELTRLRRVRNILANPQAALVVDHYDEDWQALRYVLVSCKAEMLSGEESEAATAVAQLREKYPSTAHGPRRQPRDQAHTEALHRLELQRRVESPPLLPE